MEHTHNTEDTLTQSTPTLSDTERASLWRGIVPHLTPHASIPSPFSSLLFRTNFQPTYAGALIVLLILSTSGTVFASNAARPGDVLFPVERAVEGARLKLAPTEARKDELRSRFADERVLELRELVVENTVENVLSPEGEKSVGIAVDEILTFLDKTGGESLGRNAMLEQILVEIDPFALTVEVDKKELDNVRPHKEVRVQKNGLGKSTIDIREGEKHTRVEKKNDKVQIRTKQGSGGWDDDVDDSSKLGDSSKDSSENDVEVGDELNDDTQGEDKDEDDGVREGSEDEDGRSGFEESEEEEELEDEYEDD